MGTSRRPAVAGTFYPADPAALRQTVEGFLAGVRSPAGGEAAGARRAPKALIAPHAGYVYSGSTAALAYARLAPARETITRVVLLGPTHRVAVRGVALTDADAFDTPLGSVPVEPVGDAVLDRLPQLVRFPETHRLEHSLEVHLPFLQLALASFVVLPVAVGDARPEEVADVLDEFWGGPETLVVVSSDLSHYHAHDHARRLDRATVDDILTLDGPITHQQACGASPVNGLLVAAARHGLTPELLGMCTSGDTAGDRDRVVGYAAIAFEDRADAA